MYGDSVSCTSSGGSEARTSWAATFRFSGDMASKFCRGQTHGYPGVIAHKALP